MNYRLISLAIRELISTKTIKLKKELLSQIENKENRIEFERGFNKGFVKGFIKRYKMKEKS